MHAQTEPQTKPCLSNSAFTCAGSMCEGSSTGISTVSNPHFLNCGNSFVLSLVKGEVNKNVLIPNLIVFGDGMRRPRRCEAEMLRQRDYGTELARLGSHRRRHPAFFCELWGANAAINDLR